MVLVGMSDLRSLVARVKLRGRANRTRRVEGPRLGADTLRIKARTANGMVLGGFEQRLAACNGSFRLLGKGPGSLDGRASWLGGAGRRCLQSRSRNAALRPATRPVVGRRDLDASR